MTPVFIIEVKVSSYLERYNFVHSRYDEAEVVHNEFIICMRYTSALYLVVTPLGIKFGGNMVVIIVCHFPNEG